MEQIRGKARISKKLKMDKRVGEKVTDMATEKEKIMTDDKEQKKKKTDNK